jgi:opacity protein-like surface antigen
VSKSGPFRQFARSTAMLAALAFTVVAFSFSSSAQVEEVHHFTFNVGGGVSPLVGSISNRLNTGWNVTAGAGYRVDPHFSTSLQFTYNGFGVSRRVLNEANVPGGTARMWSITLDPKINFHPGSRFNPYVVGGAGYYRRTVEFTAPTTAPAFVFDPFFGVFYTTLVPADQVLGTITRDGVGGSLGGGVDFGISHGTSFFAEARYHYAGTGGIPTRVVPVTFGLRW